MKFKWSIVLGLGATVLDAIMILAWYLDRFGQGWSRPVVHYFKEVRVGRGLVPRRGKAQGLALPN